MDEAEKLFETVKKSPFINSLMKDAAERAYQQGRKDRNDEILSQLSEQINYWDDCSNAVENGSNEHKIYTSLYRTICELYEQIKEYENKNV